MSGYYQGRLEPLEKLLFPDTHGMTLGALPNPGNFNRALKQTFTKVASKIRPVSSHRISNVAKNGLQFGKQNPSHKISQLEEKISVWLGKETKMIKNDAGDLVFISKDGLKRVRYDFNRPYPHQSPHMHVDEQIHRGIWNESGQIYPTDVPHF